jgi:hypothetical protein
MSPLWRIMDLAPAILSKSAEKVVNLGTVQKFCLQAEGRLLLGRTSSLSSPPGYHHVSSYSSINIVRYPYPIA